MFDRLRSMFSNGVSSKYRIDGVVNRHAFYTISSGRERKTMRPVHIKTYTEKGMEFERKVDRLYRNRPLSEVLPELRDRFLIETLHAEESGTKRFEITEAVPGSTLREHLVSRSLSPADFEAVVTGVGSGLSFLHGRGLIHRGLSPEGISYEHGVGARITELSFIIDESLGHAGGTVVGPVGYTAPEIIARRPVDHRSDIYSLGSIMYEMLCGVRLFPNAHGYDGLLRLMNSKPEDVSTRNACVSPELEAVVMKAVARYPEDRYQTMGELLEALAAAPLPEALGAHAPAYAA